VQSYSEFLAAVARRDADAVIAHMSAERSRKLREYRRRPNFAGLFELWCEDYSYQREVIACVIDGDCAILETETCAESPASRVTMVRNDGRWRIRCEQRAGSRIRTVTARSSHAN
jgi:ketosteroid isomerase-like protein